jgi:hypothetical protein
LVLNFLDYLDEGTLAAARAAVAGLDLFADLLNN